MKQLFFAFAFLLVSSFSTLNAAAQNRSVGAQKVLLDDGSGNTVTLQYTGPGSSTFAFPNTSGSNGQVLQTNGSGGVSWTNPAAGTLPSGAVVMFMGNGGQAGYTLVGPVGNEIDSWSNGANVPVAESQTMTTAGPNGRIYVIGGSSGTQNSNQSYDPGSNTWFAVSTLPVAQNQGVAVTVGNKIYVFGGNNGTQNNTQIYTPSTNGWTVGAPMPIAEWNMGAAVFGGKIYIFGGNGGIFANQIYDPSTNTWAVGTAIPVGQSGEGVATVGSKIYVMGGFNGAQNQNQIYDPVADSWSVGTNMPTGQQGAAVVALDNKIYVMGGFNGTSAGNQIYDVASNTWSIGKSLPSIQASGGVATTGGKIYLFGANLGSSTQIYTPALGLYYFSKN